MSTQNRNKSKPSQKDTKSKRSNKDDSLFTEVSITFSSNFETEVCFDVIDRIDEVYVEHIKNRCAEYSKKFEENVVIDTKLVSRCALLKKLIISAPPSIQAQVRRYHDITATDLRIPPAMFTIIDTFGEASNDDLTIRLKDNAFTIHNIALDTAKTFLKHSENKYRYNAVEVASFDAYTVNNTHFGDDVSTEKLRSLAEKQLDLLCAENFELTFEDGRVFNVSCSRLKVSDNLETTANNFLAWKNKLYPAIPYIDDLIHWGVLSFAQTHWFYESNLDTDIRQLVPQLTEFDYSITPQTLLNYINWKVIYYNDYRHDNMLISLVTDAYNHSFLASYTTLNKFFNLIEKSFNPYGIPAQLIWYNWNPFLIRRPSHREAKNQLRSAPTGTSLIKAKNKGLTPVFHGEVEYFQTYELCTSTGPEYLRSACTRDSLY